MILVLRSNDADETAAIAGALAPLLLPGDVVLLDGDLAAGKTLFARALAQAVGATDAATSPTYAIAHMYEGGRAPVLHLDVYRLTSVVEFHDLGLEENIERAITLVEWGARVAAAFPVRLSIAIAANGDERTLTLSAVGARWLNAWPAIKRALEPFACA